MAVSIEATEDGCRIPLRVQPRASRSETAGEHDGRVRIRLAAPPVEGAANDELIRFLARRLEVPKSAVRIAAGERGRSKTVEVAGVAPADAARLLGL